MYILFVEDQARIANLMDIYVHHLPATPDRDSPDPLIRTVRSVRCTLEA
jgi:hypothetical protein